MDSWTRFLIAAPKSLGTLALLLAAFAFVLETDVTAVNRSFFPKLPEPIEEWLPGVARLLLVGAGIASFGFLASFSLAAWAASPRGSERARRHVEATVRALLFALTIVLPVGILLVLVATTFFDLDQGYDGSLAGLVRGLARDVRELGVAGAVPLFLFLMGVSLGIREVRCGRPERFARFAAGGTLVALLACGMAYAFVWHLGALRVGYFLAGVGFATVVAAAGWWAFRARRGAKR